MSVRPRMHLVFGIDDFDGNLDYATMEKVRLHIPFHEIEDDPFGKGFLEDVFYTQNGKEWGYVTDFLYWSARYEHPEARVVGQAIYSSGYDSDLVRALSIFHPQYIESGKMDIPVLEKDKNPLRVRRLWVRHVDGSKTLPVCKDIKFQWSWFYPGVLESQDMWPVHAYTTRWLLQQAGLDIDYRRYKAMLVWDWC